MVKTIKPVWLLLLTLLFSGALQAEIHRCPDGNGGQLFQDRSCAGEISTTASSQTQSEKQFFWQATAGKGTLYLLGSIHFGAATMYPLPSIMTSTFNRSDALVVEANILNIDPRSTAQLVAEKALYRDGATLEQQLSATTWQRLKETAATLNLPVEMLNQQKPWFVSMTLTALALNRFGYSEALGIDRHFLDQAQGQKKIIELESVEWQLSLLAQLTPQEQAAMLEETLGELKDGKPFFERMLRAWKKGDADAIQALFDESALKVPGAGRINQLMIIDRNRSMTKRLEKLANQGGHYFVVVGAGHLAGDEGIIALLKQRGYRVSQY